MNTCDSSWFRLFFICFFFPFSDVKVPALGGAEPATDSKVQEADGGTLSAARETQLLDGHHCGGHAGNHQQTAVPSTDAL